MYLREKKKLVEIGIVYHKSQIKDREELLEKGFSNKETLISGNFYKVEDTDILIDIETLLEREYIGSLIKIEEHHGTISFVRFFNKIDKEKKEEFKKQILEAKEEIEKLEMKLMKISELENVEDDIRKLLE